MPTKKPKATDDSNLVRIDFGVTQGKLDQVTELAKLERVPAATLHRRLWELGIDVHASQVKNISEAIATLKGEDKNEPTTETTPLP